MRDRFKPKPIQQPPSMQPTPNPIFGGPRPPSNGIPRPTREGIILPRPRQPIDFIEIGRLQKLMNEGNMGFTNESSKSNVGMDPSLYGLDQARPKQFNNVQEPQIMNQDRFQNIKKLFQK